MRSNLKHIIESSTNIESPRRQQLLNSTPSVICITKARAGFGCTFVNDNVYANLRFCASSHAAVDADARRVYRLRAQRESLIAT